MARIRGFHGATGWLLVTLLALSTSPAPFAQQPAAPASSPRLRVSFDDGWRFKPGESEGAQAAGFDDAAWESVDLPHDFMIEGKGQAIVVPGGRLGGRGNANLPETPEGPFDPRKSFAVVTANEPLISSFAFAPNITPAGLMK